MKALNLFCLVVFALSCGSNFSKLESSGKKKGRSNLTVSNACNVGEIRCTHWFDATKQESVYSDATCTNMSNHNEEVRCWENKGSETSDFIWRVSENSPIFEVATLAPSGNHAISNQGTGSQAMLFQNYTLINSNTSATWFLVVAPIMATGIDFFFGNGNMGDNYTGLAINSEGRLFAYHGGNAVSSSTTGHLNTTMVISVVVDASMDRFLAYNNGNFFGGSNLGTVNNVYPFAIGALYDSLMQYGGWTYFGEIAIYNEALSETKRRAIEDHLKQKWQIP